MSKLTRVAAYTGVMAVAVRSGRNADEGLILIAAGSFQVPLDPADIDGMIADADAGDGLETDVLELVVKHVTLTGVT